MLNLRKKDRFADVQWLPFSNCRNSHLGLNFTAVGYELSHSDSPRK